MTEKLEGEKEKLKRAVENAKVCYNSLITLNTVSMLQKENDLLKILVNELHREIEGKNDHIKEVATQLAEAKDDVVKLEEANGRLKGQVGPWIEIQSLVLHPPPSTGDYKMG